MNTALLEFEAIWNSNASNVKDPVISPFRDEVLLSCDRRQGDHVTSEGETHRPEEEYAK